MIVGCKAQLQHLTSLSPFLGLLVCSSQSCDKG